ncbi:TetR/AcrR family transcriptional regulator [Catenulispora subtropica]|uniref:TetR family transcriptional regulator n=1 Tax=Catenulispora subtropica TaxID=450798 RepID=A0ABP5CLC5_9ACTN
MPTAPSVPTSPSGDRSLPLRERKKLRTRRALADAALTLFTAKGFDATTVDELADSVEVSKSTFFRTFPSKEAAAIEAETEVWTVWLAALEARGLSGPVFPALCDTLAEAATALPPDWDERYVATRRLVMTAAALLSQVELQRNDVKRRARATLAAKLGLDPEDLRLHVLSELTMTAWSVSAREWVRSGADGGRETLLARLHDAFTAIPASLDLAAG